jgi:hypothetical protein
MYVCTCACVCVCVDNLRAKFFSYGLMVPALPPKKLTGTQDREFLTERMQVCVSE